MDTLTEHEPELLEYALGELDAATAARVARHLETCAECRARLRVVEETLGWLGVAVPQVDPPVSLRARVLAQATGEQRSRWRQAWARRSLAAAALLLIVALLGAIVVTGQRADELAAQREMVARILAATDWSTVMRGEQANWPTAAGRVYLDREARLAIVALEGVPSPGEGQVYQLWLVRADGQRDDGGVFLPDTAGRALVVVEAPEAWRAYRGMGITVEPGPRGSPQPTGQRVAGCEWDWEAWAQRP